MAISRFPFEAQITAMPPEHQYVIRNLWNSLADVQNAIPILKSQIGGKTTSSTTSSTSSGSGGATETVIIGGGSTAGVSSFNNLTGAVTYMPQLGFVNLQTGVTSYAVQMSDGGGEIVLNDASPIAVTLNNAVIQVPFFSVISNQGSGVVTITPSSGTINGGASLTLPGGSWVTIFYDGTNWWADSPGSTVSSVTQIIAGTNVTISPVGGTGAVTVNATGGGTITGVTAGTGLSGGGTSGSVTLALATPVSVANGGTGTSTPAIVAGTGISVSGSFPNQTVGITPISGVAGSYTNANVTINSEGQITTAANGSGSGGYPSIVSSYVNTSTTITYPSSYSNTYSVIPAGMYRITVYGRMTSATGTGTAFIAAQLSYYDSNGPLDTQFTNSTTQSTPFASGAVPMYGTCAFYSDGIHAPNISIAAGVTGAAVPIFIVQGVVLERLA